jgi:hypothetical protein
MRRPAGARARATLAMMQLSDVYLSLGEDGFAQLVRRVSIGKLKTYQVYDGLKARAHLPKLNTESLRKATPRLWARLQERDEEFAQDLAQAVLVSHLDMIAAVLDDLGIPHEGGFFSKGTDPKPHLGEGWAERVFERFRETYPPPVLLFYLNHLAWEMKVAEAPFAPAAQG